MIRSVLDQQVAIRGADPRDYPAFARLFPELGAGMAVMPKEEWVARGFVDNTIVAELEGRVVGYVVGVRFGVVGHVSQLVVEPARRRRGIGRLLLAEMAARFVEAGCEQWQLNVDVANLPARRLYEAMGFRFRSRSAWILLPPETLARLPGGDYRVRPLPEAEDEAVEREFGLRQRQLAFSRRHPDCMIHEAVGADGRRCGVGVFGSADRMVHVLRLAEHGALAPLLASFPGVKEAGARLVVDGDGDLRDLLLGCGCTLEREADRLVAPLT